MSQGILWGSWAFAAIAAADVDETTVADEAALTTDEISLHGKVACEVGLTATEGNVGACDGDVTAKVLGLGGDGVWQAAEDLLPYQAILEMVQDTSKRASFSVPPEHTGSFKLLIANESGQTVSVSLKYRTAMLGEPA